MFKRFRAFLKSIPFPGRPSFGMLGWSGLPGERNYARLVGDGSGNSIVIACINWIARTFPEAPPVVWGIDKDGVKTNRRDHPLTQLLKRPTASPDNPGGFYSGVLLWMATIFSWVIDGNAYWLKIRSASGRVVQLWYVPHFMMEPRWPLDGSVYISHYDYMVNGKVTPVKPSEVVHFRNGLDPENPRKGRSAIQTVLREIYSDEEASRFTASLLKNLGIPGVILAPDTQAAGAGQFRLSQAEADDTKEKFKATFGGDNRGEPLIMSGPTKVVTFGFSPQQLDLSALRDIPEERVTAVLGIPAAIVGLGAGLTQTAVGASMKILWDQAWQSNLIPTQRIMAEEIQIQLLPEFEDDLTANEFGFDLSEVKALQEDLNQQVTAWTRLLSSGAAKRKEVRSKFGLPSGPEDDVYLPQPGVRGSLEELQFIDTELGKTDPSPATSTPAAPAPKPGAASRQVQQLEQQVQELQQQLADAKKSQADTPHFKAQVDEISRLIADLKAQGSRPIQVTIEKGAVNTPVTVDARTSIEKGAVNVDLPADLDTEVVRDASGKILGQKQRRAH